jgi:gas vesicle protein
MTTQDNRQTSERGGFISLAALAATLGAGAAILLAPEEGAKTRRRVGRGLESIRGEAAGTIAYLQRELRRRRRQSQREKWVVALTGVVVGAGISALLMTERGASTRKRLGVTLSRIKVGAVDRIDRLRERSRETTKDGSPEEQPIRSVQELGRDPDSVF